MNPGFVPINRGILEHELWKDKPFSRGQAWVDLLLKTNHEKSGFWVRGQYVEVNRGQVGRSQERLAEDWGWSRKKVRTFLKVLEMGQMITQQKGQLISLIIICKYDEYNESGANKQANKQANKGPTKGQQRATYNNENNENNENKVAKATLQPRVDKRKPELNEIVAKFEKEMELRLTRIQYQRRAAQTLLSRYGLPTTLARIEAAAAARGQQYAPVIVSLEHLRDKWNDLEEFYRRAAATQQKNQIISV